MAATKESIVMKKEALNICFDIIIPTKHGALYCSYFNCTGEVEGVALANGVQMSIVKAHAILGHGNELTMRKKCQIFRLGDQ